MPNKSIRKERLIHQGAYVHSPSMQFGNKDERIDYRRMIWHDQIVLVRREDKISGIFDLVSARQKPSPHAQQDILVGIKYPCQHEEGQSYEEKRHKLSLIPFARLVPVSPVAQDKHLTAGIA